MKKLKPLFVIYGSKDGPICGICSGQIFPCPKLAEHPVDGLQEEMLELGQLTYCPICDQCVVCEYHMSPVKTTPAIAISVGQAADGTVIALIDGREVSLEEAFGAMYEFLPPPLLISNLPHDVGPDSVQGMVDTMNKLRSGVGLIVPYGTKVEPLPLPGGYFDLFEREGEWSNKQFGDESQRGPAGPLLHMVKELLHELLQVDQSGELWAAIAEQAKGASNTGCYLAQTEYADLELLLMDAVRRAGMSATQHIKNCHDKLSINMQREWPETTPETWPTFHVKGAAELTLEQSAKCPDCGGIFYIVGTRFPPHGPIEGPACSRSSYVVAESEWVDV